MFCIVFTLQNWVLIKNGYLIAIFELDTWFKTTPINRNRMETCKAIIQQGKRKGMRCLNNVSEGYCERHARNEIYDKGLAEGKRWCRFYFHSGCNSILTELNEKSCSSCLVKLRGQELKKCESCSNKALDNEKYCGKHLRNKYKDEEMEKGVKYCDISRGCFNVCEKDKASCKECLEKQRVNDKKRLDKRRLSSNCLKCNKVYDMFKNKLNNDSKLCKECYDTQAESELRRVRERNYKAERAKYVDTHYNEYKERAIKNEMEFTLSIEEFKVLVESKCFYCDCYQEGESIGIDRLNNTVGYIHSNCVAACEECNRSKHVYHPLFFIDKTKIITGLKAPTPEFYKKWDIYYLRSKSKTFNTYKKEAEDRKLSFNLTETEYDTITRLPCYLCGYKQMNGIGIDRIDNSIREYSILNIKPCCGSCNTMKNYMETDKFKTLMKRIAAKWIDTSTVENIPLFVNPYKKNIKIDNNQIIDIPIKERKKWKSLSLYYAILANTESDFMEFNKDVVNSEELENIAKDIRDNTNKEECIKQLASFLNTVRIRRARNKKQNDNKISII